jgi:endonuclease/exonuclease/phosphatase family metal-dependent hydrolase
VTRLLHSLLLLSLLLLSALLACLTVPTHAAGLPAPGADPPTHLAELKIATWNLEWLTDRPEGDRALPDGAHPKRPEDIVTLAGYAAQLNADVIAIEEVDGRNIAARVFPRDRYSIHMTRDQVVQRVGLVVRRGLAYDINPDDTALTLPSQGPTSQGPGTGPGHLRSGADITLHLPGGPLRILAVHLKALCWRDPLTRNTPACKTLLAQLPPLQAWITAPRQEAVPFIVLGDFNRWMDDQDQFIATLRQAAPLARATEGHANPCWGGERFIDHILAGGPAAQWMDPATLSVLVFRETGAGWKERLSDHCAIAVRFRLPA